MHTTALLRPSHLPSSALSFAYIFLSSKPINDNFLSICFLSQLLVPSCKYPTHSIAVFSFCPLLHSCLLRTILFWKGSSFLSNASPLFDLPNEQLRFDIFLCRFSIAHSFFFLRFLGAPVYPFFPFVSFSGQGCMDNKSIKVANFWYAHCYLFLNIQSQLHFNKQRAKDLTGQMVVNELEVREGTYSGGET